jgi:hypothetical protein
MIASLVPAPGIVTSATLQIYQGCNPLVRQLQCIYKKKQAGHREDVHLSFREERFWKWSLFPFLPVQTASVRRYLIHHALLSIRESDQSENNFPVSTVLAPDSKRP